MEVNLGSSRFTRIVATDDPALGNRAHHHYQVEGVKVPTAIYAQIDFQDGPVNEAEINGVHHEDLLNIVLHRLQCFQSGDFRCRENALAITKIEEALMWLNARTSLRQKKGIEGTNVNHE